jgi:membrane-bound serine protease (ClpP class)
MRMRRRGGITLAACSLVLVATAMAAAASAAPPAGHRVLRVTLDGVVDPFAASYIRRAIASADPGNGDVAMLLTIDTPGGLDSSMREIVKAILASRVPVLCYTGPSGARAASAGTFVMLSCPVAAMAPGTNIGAAHPVGVSGAIEQAKVTNDAAAFIRSLAERWGRNAGWAERAVRDSVSVAAAEAARIHVVDLTAASERVLLDVAGNCLHGVIAAPSTGLLARRETLPELCGADVVGVRIGLGAGILHRLIDPNLAFLFFYAGLALIVVELLHPGLSLPGVLGTLMLITSFVSFGFLPVRIGGVVLLVASAVFFLLELKHPGIGLPTVGGLVTLVLGGLLLFDPSVPNARVSPWLLAVMAVALGVFFGVVVKAVLAARHLPVSAGIEELVGREGVAITDLTPRGQVRARGEEWSAESTGLPIPSGSPVRVARVQGLRLVVEPATAVTEEGKPAGRAVAGPKGGTA